MNSIFPFMNAFLVAAISVSVLAPDRTSAAVCSAQTNFLCVATDYTLASCSKASLVCDCKSGFQPIPTGCARSPPIVDFGTRIGQRVDKAEVKLTCFTTEPGSLTFEWKKDGTTRAEKTPEITLTGDDATVLGKYSCTVKDSAPGSLSRVSEEAEIVAVNADRVTPVVTVPTQTAAAGAPLDVQCVGIPFGATYKFRLDSSTLVEPDKVVQDSTYTNITCVLDDVNGVAWKRKESAPVKMPTVAKDITEVTISPSTDLIVKDGDTVTFTCGTIPDAKYMGDITYNFVLDSRETKPNVDDNKYTLTPTDKTPRRVSCSAKYGINVAHKSANVTVSFNNSDISAVLRASSTTVYPGSRLILTCVTDPLAQITWIKDSKIIPGETERIIQFGRFQATDAGKYLCSVTKQLFTANSTEVTITSSAPQVRALGSAVTVLVAVLAVLGWRAL